MQITKVTRTSIADVIVVEGIVWSGRMEEHEFLSRVFDLKRLPSTDTRFPNAHGDIWQHRVRNPDDWDDDWVFYDRRFDLINTDDELFLQFLCETLHPVVRPNATEVERLCQLYNSFLEADGFKLVETTKISGRPVFTGRHIGMAQTPGIQAAKETFTVADASYIAKQITRMEAAVENDPDLAIGTAKELIETCCKTILKDRNIEIPKKTDIPKLIKLTCKELKLTPNDIPKEAKAAEIIKRLLNNLATIANGAAELRNLYGTGHGKPADTKGLDSRHAKLAVGAASTLAVFLTETHSITPASPEEAVVEPAPAERIEEDYEIAIPLPAERDEDYEQKGFK